ncbi:hypothetical protein FF38_02747 [Lucilia cuprina]|uniref:Uncharacterized protein n=1 Tax=Lucilia cuprina TaxID=7375 RepID=A0A0L0CQ37_LUCCU|nr:hypothetical protein CVS40_0744 [Lucilia cuprina]KNC34468.1 hypothetical protein FF38_02747 [Lucilia cuprina]
MKFLHFVISLCLMCMFMSALTKAAPMPTVPAAYPTPPVGNGNAYTGPSTRSTTVSSNNGPPVSTEVPLYGA